MGMLARGSGTTPAVMGLLAVVACTEPAEDPVPSSTDGASTGSSTTAAASEAGAVPSDDTAAESTGDAPACIAEGEIGRDPGQVVPPVLVTRCDGSTVTLQELLCQYPLTLIDIGGASFQICVDATDEYATSPEWDALQAKGLGIVQVFALDDQNQTPTTSFCSEYVQTHAIDFDFLIDQLGATHTLAPSYPFNMVVDAQGVVIHRWEVDLPEDRLEILDALLDGL